MAQHDHRMSVWRATFFRQKAAPQDRFDAQDLEVIIADEFAPCDFRASAVARMASLACADARRSHRPREQPRQAFVLPAEIHVVRVRKPAPNLRFLLIPDERRPEFIRFFDWQW